MARAVVTVVGLEVTERLSGLRGVEVRWTDATGVAHSRVYDNTVLTCPADTCDFDHQQRQAIIDLGLLQP